MTFIGKTYFPNNAGFPSWYNNTNRLSSTIDSNSKIDQLRTTSQGSNVKRKTTCCPTS